MDVALVAPAPTPKKDKKRSEYWRGMINRLMRLMQVHREDDLTSIGFKWACSNKKI
jgi:hypothetical protein